MAHVSILGEALGAVAGSAFPEGALVTLSASGLHRDLPTALVAASGTTAGVFVAFAVPDQFPRPTPLGMFGYNDTTSRPYGADGATEHRYTHDTENAWLIGPSVLPTVTIASGWKVALHRDGYYKLQPSEYHNSAGIKVAGAKVRIGVSGLVELDPTGANAVGYVREYLAFDGSITVKIGA